jgi:hypothetical protein
MIDFIYDDTAPWPFLPDGAGFSLVLIDPTSAPDHALASNWTSGTVSGGTPGGPEPETSGLEHYLASFLTPRQMADPAISGPLADPELDGYSNLLEYTLGGHPLAFDQLVDQTTVAHLGEDYPALTFLKRTNEPDLEYVTQISTDLVTWNEGGGHLIESSAVDLGDGFTFVTVRSVIPVSDAEGQFLRLKVVQANP